MAAKAKTENTLSPETILEAIAARPQGFLVVEFDKCRVGKKNPVKYHDLYIILANGTKRKLCITWGKEVLTGGIKEKAERKYGVAIQFRRSSGTLGEALCKIYAELARMMAEGVEKKTIKLKKDQTRFRSIVQTELEDGTVLDDPIIRMGIPFGWGKFSTKIIQIEDRGGVPTPVQVPCTEDNIHEKIVARMSTGGHADMEAVVFSSQGISIPCKVKTLVIKPPEMMVPDADAILTPEQMREYCVPSTADTEKKVNDSRDARNASSDGARSDATAGDNDTATSASVKKILIAGAATEANAAVSGSDLPDIESALNKLQQRLTS